MLVEQNFHTGEPGDWFKLAPQFYFVGYGTRNWDDFDPWMLFNWPAVVLATHDGDLLWQLNQNKDGRARASFKHSKMRDAPPRCIIASGFGRS